MKKSRFFLALLFVSLLFVLLPATAKADLWEVPVAPGESFRWVFVTSQPIAGTSPDVVHYNNFINYGLMPLLPVTPLAGIAGKDFLGEVDWMAIASTHYDPVVLDNIGVSAGGIYGVQGDQVATDVFALVGGLPLLSRLELDEFGNIHPGGRAWTGIAPAWWNVYMPLGTGDVIVGDIGVLDSTWLSYDAVQHGQYPYTQNYLYAISEELTVVPVPGAIILAATGLLSSALGLKRLRRKHQE